MMSFKQLQYNIQRMWAMQDDGGDGDYIPELYLKSNYLFKPEPKHTEKAIKDTIQAILRIQDQLRCLRLKKPKTQPLPATMEIYVIPEGV